MQLFYMAVLLRIRNQVIYPKTKNKYGKYWSSIWFNKNTQIIKEIETANDEVAVCAQFETLIGKLIVYGTIIAYKDFLIKEGSQPWEEHYKSIKWHGEDWFNIISGNPNVPFVVAGDFNQTRDGSNRYSTSEGINLLGTLLEKCNLECVTEENFTETGKLNADPNKGYPRANIDHICISKNFFNSIEVGAWDHFNDERNYTSDHNGVFIDLYKLN